MSRIEFAAEVAGDLDRIVEHLIAHDVANAAARVREIIRAIDVLADNPCIGRPNGTYMRELIIGRDTRGYIALYRYIVELDMVLVLAIRGQRESGYART